MAVAKLKQIWENEYFKTAIMIVLMIAIVFGFWYGSQLVLNTQYPGLAVASGSMCTVKGMRCDGWSHPFETTLHIGDLIIVQGINPEEIKAAPYPDGDIIVFRQQYAGGELIVHRAIAKEKRDDKWYFQTQGDGNAGPDSPTPNIPEDHVIGKVVLRIPWVGHIALFLRNSSGIFIILFFIIILVIIEFIIPVFIGKEAEAERKENLEKAFET
ncbi:MAG: signal peptidase I [Candidatus Bathyarchaeota archaeon]|nr:signal peptidase I [Candidatus Bathyarchaeota archaeon]